MALSFDAGNRKIRQWALMGASSTTTLGPSRVSAPPGQCILNPTHHGVLIAEGRSSHRHPSTFVPFGRLYAAETRKLLRGCLLLAF